jgi:hypothetical protein
MKEKFMKKITTSILLFAICACNAKGVECADSTQPCVSTQVNDDSHDLSFDNTYDNDQSNNTTTINNDTVIVNNPVVNIPIGEGGSGGYAGATGTGSTSGVGGAGGSDNSVDAGTDADAGTHTIVMCDSPNAVGTDVRNWFVPSSPPSFPTSYTENWFQLITFDGFSADRCVYTGKIKWYHEDQYGYWVSDREWDSPNTIFTIEFTTDGFVKGDYHAPTTDYPNGYLTSLNVSVTGCYSDLPEDSLVPYRAELKYPYQYFVCLCSADFNHPFQYNVFRGTWVNNRPTVTQQILPFPRG